MNPGEGLEQFSTGRNVQHTPTPAHTNAHRQRATTPARAPASFGRPKRTRHSVTASTAHGHKPRAQPSSKTNQGGRMKEKNTPPKATEEQVNQQQDSGKITAITFLKSHRSIEQIFDLDLREALQDSADELPERTQAEWDKFLRELAIVYPRMRAAKETEIAALEEGLAAVAADYIEAGRISRIIEEQKRQLDHLYAAWENAEEELNRLMEQKEEEG